MSTETDLEKPKPNHQEQLGTLKTLFDAEAFWAMKPEDFPNVPPLVVARMRFISAINQASYFLTPIGMISNELTRDSLRSAVVGMIIEAEEDMTHTLRSLPASRTGLTRQTEADFIASHNFFRQAGESNGALEFILRNGLVDQINSINFPALRALSERELAEVKMNAAGNRLENLRVQRQRLDKVGYQKSSGAVVPLVTTLDMEIKLVEDQFIQLLGKSLEK